MWGREEEISAESRGTGCTSSFALCCRTCSHLLAAGQTLFRRGTLLREQSVQEVSAPARAMVGLLGHLASLLGACSEGRGGAGMSALVGSWLTVFAVREVWGGVCAPETSAPVQTELLVFSCESFLLKVAAGPFVSSGRRCLLHLCPKE